MSSADIVGRALAALDVQVDVMISSPLKRATQTASLVGNELGYEGKLQLEDGLRPGASFADFRKLLEKYARHEAIMVVGHNPNLSEFLGRSISETGCEAGTELKKGAVAKVEMGRNSAHAAMVSYSESSAYALCRRGGELASEDFAEIVFFFFDRPKFQIHAASLLGDQRQFHFALVDADARAADRAAAAQIQARARRSSSEALARIPDPRQAAL